MARLLIRDLQPGATYQLQLRAVNVDTVSQWSPKYPLTVTGDVAGPDTPAWAVSNPWIPDGTSFIATWQHINFTLDNNKDFSHYQITFTDGADSWSVNTTNNFYVLTFEENKARFGGTPRPTILAKVRSVDATGNASAYSSELSASNPVPDAPTSVDAVAISDGIKISWVDSTADDVVGYNIYIGTSPAPTTKLAFTSSNPYTYTSLTFVAHYVRIRAVDVFGQESAYSSEDSATPESPFVFDTNAPAAPGAFTVTITNENTAAVIPRQIATATWTHPGESDLAGFHFRFKKTTDSTWTAYDIEPDARSFAVALPEAFANYNFEIRAYDFYTNRSAWVSDGDQLTSYTTPTFLTSLIIGSGGYIESSSFGTGVGFHIDDDGITIYDGLISGGAITTGVIRSSDPALDQDGNPIAGEYAWQIDLEGDAVFGDVKVRGNMVVGDAAGPTTSIIQSGNYVAGQTGWAVLSTGFAEFRDLAADSIDGDVVIINESLTVSKLRAGPINGEITLESGSIAAYGQLGEKVSFSASGFESLGSYAVPINTAALTSNVATFTTDYDHGFIVGNVVDISDVGGVYDGEWIIASTPTTTTFTVAITASDITSAAVVGTAKSVSTNPDLTRPTLISFPTDGTNPNIISGMLTADTLTVANSASFRNEAELEYGATMTIASEIQSPRGVPVLSHDYNEISVPWSISDPRSLTVFTAITVGHDGDWYAIDNKNRNVEVIESSGTSAGNWNSRFLTAIDFIGKGMVYSSNTNKYYILESSKTAIDELTHKIRVYTTAGVLQSTSSAIRTFTITAGRPSPGLIFEGDSGTIGWDHINNKLLYAYYNHATNEVKVRTYSLDGSGNLSTLDSTTNMSSTSGKDDPVFVGFGAYDFGANRFVVKDSRGTYSWNVFNSSGTAQNDEFWPAADGEFTTAGFYNSTDSRFMELSSHTVKTHYGGTSYWTSGSDKFWVGYTWYDSVGTTHETTLSPLSGYSLPKRARLNATINKIPYDGGADSPNMSRVWVYNTRQGTKPASTGSTWKLRSTLVGTERVATIDPDGTIPGNVVPTTNGFIGVGGGPAQIISSTGLSFWKGDDTAQFYKLTVASDVAAASGTTNQPPLRVKNTTSSKELRLDNNQILSVLADGTPDLLSINQDAGGDGPVNIRGMIKTGTKPSGSITANTDKTVSVTFGTAFPSTGPTPNVYLTAQGVSALANAPEYEPFNITKSGFDIVLRRSNTTQFDIGWIAVATTAG